MPRSSNVFLASVKYLFAKESNVPSSFAFLINVSTSFLSGLSFLSATPQY